MTNDIQSMYVCVCTQDTDLLQRAVQLRDGVLGLEEAAAGRAAVLDGRLDGAHLVLQALRYVSMYV